MKFSLLALLLTGSLAYAQSMPMATSPKDACMKITEAAKKGDFDAVMQLSMPMHSGGKERSNLMKKDFHKMRTAQMEKLKDLECSSEHRVGDHAFVTAKTGDSERMIPFVKEGETWRFDARTYMSFYRDAMPEGMKHKHMHPRVNKNEG